MSRLISIGRSWPVASIQDLQEKREIHQVAFRILGTKAASALSARPFFNVKRSGRYSERISTP